MKNEPIPSCQALIFQPELTHCTWTDIQHRKRSIESLRQYCIRMIKTGKWSGYRFMTIHEESIGLPTPTLTRRNAQSK